MYLRAYGWAINGVKMVFNLIASLAHLYYLYSKIIIISISYDKKNCIGI